MTGNGEIQGIDPDGKCAEALTAMYLFLDNEQMDSADRAHVQEHLDACIPCLESFEFEAELKQVIRRKCKDDAPDALYKRIQSTLKLEITNQTPKSQPPAN